MNEIIDAGDEVVGSESLPSTSEIDPMTIQAHWKKLFCFQILQKFLRSDLPVTVV